MIFVLSGHDDGVRQPGSGGQLSPVLNTELSIQAVQRSHLLSPVVNLPANNVQHFYSLNILCFDGLVALTNENLRKNQILAMEF